MSIGDVYTAFSFVLRSETNLAYSGLEVIAQEVQVNLSRLSKSNCCTQPVELSYKNTNIITFIACSMFLQIFGYKLVNINILYNTRKIH